MHELHEEIDQNNLLIWQKQYSKPDQNFTEARKILKSSEKINYQKGIAYALLNLAKACFLKSNNKEAFEFVTKCLPYFYENTNEQGYSWLLVLQGNMMESIGDYEKGLELCIKALKKSKEINDLETEAEAASVLGLIYTRLCNFSKALDYYKRALKIREEMGDEDAMASSLNRIGMINRLVKEYDKALKYYYQSLEIRERKKLIGAIPWTMLGLASTFEDMGKYAEALDYYQRGEKDFDKRCVLQCKIGIGRIYSNQGKGEMAEVILNEALLMANELNAKPLIVEIYSALGNYFELSGQYKKSLECFKKFQQTKELVLSEESQNRLRNIEISHAVEKTMQEKEIYRLKHVELKAAFDVIAQKNREITDSITYARYIQQAILPNPCEIDGLLDQCFILYQPKAIIGGDFYWFTEKDDLLIFAAADCTGHGVPGALMSMLGVSLLNEIVNELNILDASEILNMLRTKVISSLRQLSKENITKDGMDISLCVLNRKNSTIQYAGAYNSLYLIRSDELIEYKADKMPIGLHAKMENGFKCQTIKIIKNDMIYLCSDGYADQFGGPDGKKFKSKGLTDVFIEVHNLELRRQKEVLENKFLEWKGTLEQMDDVLVFGYKVE